MLAGEDGAGGCPCPQRADRLIDAAVHDGATKSLVPQVAHHVPLQPLDKVAADKPAGPAY